jgi:hypothetical protein
MDHLYNISDSPRSQFSTFLFFILLMVFRLLVVYLDTVESRIQYGLSARHLTDPFSCTAFFLRKDSNYLKARVFCSDLSCDALQSDSKVAAMYLLLQVAVPIHVTICPNEVSILDINLKLTTSAQIPGPIR